MAGEGGAKAGGGVLGWGVKEVGEVGRPQKGQMHALQVMPLPPLLLVTPTPLQSALLALALVLALACLRMQSC